MAKFQDPKSQRKPSAHAGSKRKHSSQQHISKHDAQEESQTTVNKTKRRLRNVRRLLENNQGALRPEKRDDLEREQASLEHELRRREDKSFMKQMISKYHMVRFFGVFFYHHAISHAHETDGANAKSGEKQSAY